MTLPFGSGNAVRQMVTNPNSQTDKNTKHNRKVDVFMALKERTQKIIEQYNLNEKIENLTKDLLAIPYAADVEYDLDGFVDNIPQVIFLVKYDIPVSWDTYFERKNKLVFDIVETAKKHGLRRSEDSIEDYGQHFYCVFYHDKNWRN